MKTLVEIMTHSYLETALWSSHNYDSETDDSISESFDGDYDISDFSCRSHSLAYIDCENLIAYLECEECEGYDSLLHAAMCLQDIGRIGHDFWLTRNGHGAGFWDGDYGSYGDLLTEVCQNNFGECNLFAVDGVYVEIE